MNKKSYENIRQEVEQTIIQTMEQKVGREIEQ